MVRAVASEDLVTPRDGLRDTDRVLVRFGPTKCEERLLDVAGEQRGELAA